MLCVGVAGCTIMPGGKKKKSAELQKKSSLATQLDDSPIQEEGLAAEEDTDTEEWMSKYIGENQMTWFVGIIKTHAGKALKEMLPALEEQFAAKINSKFEETMKVIDNLRSNVQLLSSKVQDMSDEIGNLQQSDAKQRRKIEQLQQNNADVKSSLRNADIMIDVIQQKQYHKDLQIVGMPEPKDADDRKQLIKLSKEKMGIKLKSSDIKEITRMGKKTDSSFPRNLIVSFHDKSIKEKLCEHKKKLTPHKDPKRNIYLNDHLTKHRQNLLYAARQLVKSKKLFAAWSQGGNILVRKKESSKITQVSDHPDLIKIKEEDDYGRAPRSLNSKSDDTSTVLSHLSNYDFEYDSEM